MLKGGVGKSTLSVNLSRQLAADGYNVLLIDLDPNGHASVGLGVEEIYHDSEETIGDVFFDSADPQSVIHNTDYEFDMIPSSDDLEQVEREIVVGDVFQPSALLKREVVEPLLGYEYDYIVSDSPAYRSRLPDNALSRRGTSSSRSRLLTRRCLDWSPPSNARSARSDSIWTSTSSHSSRIC